MPEVLQEPFALTQADATGTDGAHSTAFSQIWIYQVPSGIGLILLSGHTFAVYLYGDDAAEMPAATQIKISVLDPSKQDEQNIVGPFPYANCKTFDDRDKMFRLNVTAPFKVYEKQYLRIMTAGYDVAGTAGVDVSACYFELAISRVRQPL